MATETISPISKNGGGQSVPPPTASLGVQNIADNYDTFLNLLTVQLQNQDPLNPMDPTQFVSQLAQFSQLEQSVAQTSAFEEVAALSRASEARAGLDFLGREVEAESDTIVLANGAASFDYEVASPGEKLEIRIFDSNDKLVAKLDAEKTAGRHAMVWDGVNETGGDAAPGVYHAELVSVKDKQAESAGRIIVTDTVNELRYTQSGAALYLQSGAVVSPSAVLSVRNL